MSDAASNHPRGVATVTQALAAGQLPAGGRGTSSPAAQNLAAEVEALRAKAEVLQTIVDSLAEGLAAVDRSGRFVQFNPSGAEILGKGATEGPYEAWPKTYGLYLPDRETPFPHDQLPLIRALDGESLRDVEMYHRPADSQQGRWLKVNGAPIRDAQGRITGGVVLFRDETATKEAQEALENERRYLRHLIQWQDRQRQLTAFDLHDGLVQLVTGAVLHLEAYRNKHAAANSQADGELGGVLSLLRDALDDARRLIGGLQPPVLHERGVVGAIEYLVEQHRKESGLAVEFVCDLGADRWPSEVEATVFRITQEALQNVVRHAESSRALVTLKLRDEQLELNIRDWGKGFCTQDRKSRRFGLRGITERSRLIGGSVEIESSPGQGTSITALLPTRPTPPDTEESAS